MEKIKIETENGRPGKIQQIDDKLTKKSVSPQVIEARAMKKTLITGCTNEYPNQVNRFI